MERNFVEVVLQEFLENTKIDQETKMYYHEIDQKEEDFFKALNKRQIEKFEEIEDLIRDCHYHELERLVAYMFRFLKL